MRFIFNANVIVVTLAFITLTTTTTPTTTTSITDTNFLNYNSSAGDSVLTKGDDDTFGPFPMTQPIPYLDTFYSNYYICVNGFIGFITGRQIYPYNIDLETSNTGDIFYRQLNSADLNILKTSSSFLKNSSLLAFW
jgi:hypothetical protein